MKSKLIILVILLIGGFCQLDAANRRAFMLGGGGTNMSKNSWKYDRNGLRTGTRGDVHNLFGIYADGAYSCLFNTIPYVSYKPGGYGVGGGICYEHQRGMFKMQVGLGLRYQNVANDVGDTTFYDLNVRDARGYNYSLRYDFFDRVDRAFTFNGQLPVLFGVGVKGFYSLAGFKINYNITGKSFVTAMGTTSGIYPQFLGQFFEMDNHGFRKDVQLERKDMPIQFKMDLLLALEAGYEWGKNIVVNKQAQFTNRGAHLEYRLRIAAFMEYGLLNICPNQDLALVAIPTNYKWDFPEYRLNYVFSSSVAQSEKIHNFYAGIKLTVLIGSYTDKRCVLCSGWKSEVDMSSGKSKSTQKTKTK